MVRWLLWACLFSRFFYFKPSCGVLGFWVAFALIVGPPVFGQEATSAERSPLAESLSKLPPGQFAGELHAYFGRSFYGLPPVSREEGSDLVQIAWDRFLRDEEVASTVDPGPLLKVVSVVRPRLAWLREGDAPVGGDTRNLQAYERRVREVEASIRQRILENQSGVHQEFAVLSSAWSDFMRPELADDEQFLASRSQAFSGWMKANDWRQLSTHQKVELLRGLLADRLDRRNFAVRWTGLMTAPEEGVYQFGQLRHCLNDGTCRMIIGDRVVLERAADVDLGDDQEVIPLGMPVELKAGVATPITVEYRYSERELARAATTGSHAELYPMMVLTWQVGAEAPQVVPSKVFFHVAETGRESQAGLLAECYSGEFAGAPVATSVVEGIAEVWKLAPVVPEHPEELKELTADLLERLAASEGEPLRGLMRVAPTELSRGLSKIEDRRRLADALLSRESDLRELTAWQFSSLFSELAMLSGTKRLDLLSAWSGDHCLVVNSTPGKPGDWTFSFNYHAGFENIACWLTGVHRQDLDRLVEERLVREDGMPSLDAIVIAAHGLRTEQDMESLLSLVREQLDQPLAGETLAAWLIAHGWVEEIRAVVPVNPAVSLPIFKQALAAVENDDGPLAFLATCEVIVRQLYAGQVEDAQALLEASQSKFRTEHAQQVLQLYQSRLSEYPQLAAEQEQIQAARQAQASLAGRVEALQSRLESAELRGDGRSAARYRQRLQEMQLGQQD